MGSGNSMADNADREYQRRGSCACGANDWEEIDWCAIDKCQCDDSSCPANLADTACEMMETRLLCKKCGAIVEGE